MNIPCRGFPVIKDATMEDAQDIGLTELTTVIGNGNEVGGTWLPHISSEAREALESADLIIAKGQSSLRSMITSLSRTISPQLSVR